MNGTTVGAIGWVDLTVPEAESLRDFYARVVGWKPQPVDMGGYADFNMTDAEGTARAGVCHRRGTNAELPPVWMVYFLIEDLARSLDAVRAAGGRVLVGPKGFGPAAKYAVIEDPAGAICALFENRAAPR
jgi:predicted enzyme related to lactoylglutathione lyase